MPKVLAFDQATKTGWATGDEAGLDARPPKIIFGRLDMPRRPDGERLVWLLSAIQKLITEHQPDLIVYETPWFPWANPSVKIQPTTLKWLQKVEATVMIAAGISGIPTEDYAPASWRKTLLGFSLPPKGAEPKHMKNAVYLRLRAMGLRVQNTDDADAIGILYHALCGEPASMRKQGDLLAMTESDL